MTHDVFISYSHKDKPIADAVCTNLEIAGVRCWIAPRDMMPGEDWPEAIGRTIPQSRVMVMVFSSNSNASVQVYRELFLASSNNVIIIPFKIEDVEPEPRVGYLLAGTHWLDAMNPPMQEQIDKLVQCVKSFLANPQVDKPVRGAPIVTPSPMERPKPEPARRLPAWTWGILITVILVGGAASVYLWRQTSKATPLTSPVPALTNPPAILATQALDLQTVPALTNTPEISATPALGTQDEQARTFAEPIMAAIAQYKPDFEDDFSKVNPVWTFGGRQGFSSVIEEGVARLRINQGEGFMSDSKYLVKSDFVLQFDARLVSGDTTSKIMVSFHSHPETQQFFLELYPALQNWDISSDWDGLMRSGEDDAVSPVGETMQVTIITRGSRFALYLNQTPISFIDDKNIYSGLIGNNSRRIFIHCESEYISPAVCEFDNVKFWNLANIPGLP